MYELYKALEKQNNYNWFQMLKIKTYSGHNTLVNILVKLKCKDTPIFFLSSFGKTFVNFAINFLVRKKYQAF